MLAHIPDALNTFDVPYEDCTLSHIGGVRKRQEIEYSNLNVIPRKIITVDASYLLEATSETLRPARPHLAVGLEALYHHIPLSLILPKGCQKSRSSSGSSTPNRGNGVRRP